MLAPSGWSRAEDFIISFHQRFRFFCVWPIVRTPNVLSKCHLGNEKGTGANMRPAMVCGIVTGRAGQLLANFIPQYQFQKSLRKLTRLNVFSFVQRGIDW